MARPPVKNAAKLTPNGTTLVGVGFRLVEEPNCLRVEILERGGGAEAVGIVVGDRVIAVDGHSVVKLGRDGSIAKILGPAHTKVALTLWRNGAAVTLTIDRIPIKKKLSLEFSDTSDVLERKISP